jgi:4-amino-4-deoxy-L-arabinose transferase-like glycosyltransferase
MKRHFSTIFIIATFVFSATTAIAILIYGNSYGLFSVPHEGTDQLTMLKAAVALYHGNIPEKNFYSPLYIFYLYLLVLASGGKLFIMTLLQGIMCALIPPVIYKLCRAIRMNRRSSALSALLYCFYGPASLLSLALLRAVPLSLCFALTALFIVRGFTGKSSVKYFIAGVFAGMCMLGRENFIPVVYAPLTLLIFKDIRHYFRWKHLIWYSVAVLLTIAPAIIYNTILYSSPSIVPGHLDNIFTDHHREAHGLGEMVASVIKRLPIQFNRFVSSYELDNSVSFYAHRDIIPFMNILFIPYNALLALAVVALIWIKKLNRGRLFIAVLIAAYIVSMLPFDVYYRYRIPLVPLLAVLAGAGFECIINGKKLLTRLMTILVALLIFCMTWTPPGKLRRHNERYAVADILINNKAFDRAEKYMDKLDRDGVPSRAPRLRLVRALVLNGQFEKADAIYKDLILKKTQSQDNEPLPDTLQNH